MLKSWSIENFKPIVNSGDLKLAPVTVLAGRNSSGKSSLLQSILMIAQTLSNQLPDRALLPNERIVQLGTFEDILSEFSSENKLITKFEIYYEEDELAQSLADTDALSNKNSSYYQISVTFKNVSDENAKASAVESSKVIVDDFSLLSTDTFPAANESLIKEKSEAIKYHTKLVIKKRAEDEHKNHIESAFSDTLFTHILGKFNHIGEMTSYNNADHPTRETAEYLIELSHFLPTNFIRIRREVPPENLQTGFFGEIFVEEAVEFIISFFASKIRYLGPLRADPSITQRIFAPTSQLDDVGFKGEYAAVVYQNNQFAHIAWYNPYTCIVEQGTLQYALDSWLRYLNVAEQVRTEAFGSMGVAWKVILKKGQKARTLPEVGVGISQILPILVMGLLSPIGTLLIVEQPELHLHPSVQAHLGDFFVGLSKCKKQCLIETHSENLVSQLRYHIVQSGGMDKSDCIIYFVDQDEKGAAQFNPIEISPQGNILNWPEGFFDETMLQEDRITAASIKKRAAKAKNA